MIVQTSTAVRLSRVSKTYRVGTTEVRALNTPTGGAVEVCGEDVARLNDDTLADFRARNIGFIFQNFSLVPVLTAYENTTPGSD